MEKRRMIYIIMLAVCIILGTGVFSRNAEAAGRPKLNKSSITIKEKKKYSLKVKNISKKKIKSVIYKSSKKSVAKISSKGKITAKKAGKTTITCKVVLKNKKKYVLKCKVKVTKVKRSTSKADKKEVTIERDYDPDEDEHEEYNDYNVIEATTSPEPTTPSTSEPTPKYEYKVEVLNEEETLYNTDDQLIILHIITDNPDSDTFTVKGNDISEHSFGFGWGDVHYIKEDKELFGGFMQPVRDGYICTVSFESAGEKEIKVYEGVEYSIKYSETYTYYGYKYTINTNDGCNLTITDYAEGEEEYLASVMEDIFTDEMTDYEKICAFSNYLVKNYHYTSYTEKGDILLREWADVWWRSGVLECGSATNIVGKMADRLGLKWEAVHMTGLYETENRGQIFGASGHVCNKICIDGEEYIFDGCPNGYSAKEYAEDEIDYII